MSFQQLPMSFQRRQVCAWNLWAAVKKGLPVLTGLEAIDSLHHTARRRNDMASRPNAGMTCFLEPLHKILSDFLRSNPFLRYLCSHKTKTHGRHTASMVQDRGTRREGPCLRPIAQALRVAHARGVGEAEGALFACGASQGASRPRRGGVFIEGERIGQAC